MSRGGSWAPGAPGTVVSACLIVRGSVDLPSPFLPLSWNPQLALGREGWAGKGELGCGVLEAAPRDMQARAHAHTILHSQILSQVPHRVRAGKTGATLAGKPCPDPSRSSSAGRRLGVLLVLVRVGSETPLLHLGDGVMSGGGEQTPGATLGGLHHSLAWRVQRGHLRGGPQPQRTLQWGAGVWSAQAGNGCSAN